MIAFAAALVMVPFPQELGSSSMKPLNRRTRTEIAEDHLYDCYVVFVEGKGFDSGTADRLIRRWDKAARRECAPEIRVYRRRVGPQRAEAAWSKIWGDYTSRD